MGNKRITCAACGFVGNVSGRGNWAEVHRDCPKRDHHVDDATPCPVHGQNLVWTVGPYSTFKECHARASCGAGRDRRGHAVAFRVYPDKGINTPKAEPVKPTPEPLVTTTAIIAPIESHPLSAYGPLGDAVAQYVEARAQEIAAQRVLEALKNHEGKPTTIRWTVNDKPFATVEAGRAHKLLPRVLKLIAGGFRNIMLVGPAGSGKTTLAKQVANALNRQYAAISCSVGMGESKLAGRSIPRLTGDVATVFQSTEFVDLYEAGGVFLIDEIDASDANVLVVINAALANGYMPLPDRVEAPKATRHADSVIIVAANTYGNGADRVYVGRNQLDGATLDRFVGAVLTVDYDRDLERSILLEGSEHDRLPGLDPAVVNRICSRVWEIRDRAASTKVRKPVGTRFLVSVARLVECVGDTLDEAINIACEAWTPQERSLAGVN